MTHTTFRRWTKSDSFPPLQDQNKKQDHRFSTSSLFSLSLSVSSQQLPTVPIMLRALPDDLPDEDRPSSRPAKSTEPQDERPSEISSAVPKPSAQSSKPEPSGLSNLHKCTHCHMAFLSATGLHQHMQECHDPAVLDPDHASPVQIHKKMKTSSRTIQQMLGLPPSGPIPEAPRQFECPLCLETVGQKALTGHLRREHQAIHIGAFPFVPDHDMLPGSLTCRHCYSTFTMEQALITHFKRGSHKPVAVKKAILHGGYLCRLLILYGVQVISKALATNITLSGYCGSGSACGNGMG